jgi:HlyD family type I secretion membrane fusion protein
MSLPIRRNVGALVAPLQEPLAPPVDLPIWQRQARSLGTTLLVFIGGFMLWSAAAPLNGAIVAPGQVKSELNRKVVQHQEGGILRAILVRTGDRVKAGQPLVEITDVRSSSSNSIVADQLASESLRRARLEAEALLAPSFAPPAVDARAERAAEYLTREKAVFAVQRRNLDQQIEVLSAQIRETEQQIRALESQSAATESSLKTARDELELNQRLVGDGYVPRAKLLTLERAVTDYESSLGEYRGNLSQARQRIQDYRLRSVQARNEYQAKAAADLKDSVAKIDQLQDQQRATVDQVERQTVRAPVDGTVMALRVTAPGQAVAPREPILEIVPSRERLLVDARVNPNDIDHVTPGTDAEVRLTAYEYRRAPLLTGKVVNVSADILSDEKSGLSWYSVLIEVDGSQLKAARGVFMQAGMQAEVFVTTPGRSMLEYLLHPLYNFTLRGMREP